MRRTHFEYFDPVCPVCARRNGASRKLVLAEIYSGGGSGNDDDVEAGILHCSDARCRHEYPIIDFIPVIVPDLRRLMSERGVDLMTRCDLDPALESLIGDAIGPDSWFDGTRQILSTYAWDAFADLDPDEQPPSGGPSPGAARACLSRLLSLAVAPSEAAAPSGAAIDLGCGAGRTTFELADFLADGPAPGPVLGVDTNLGLLRIARAAAGGTVSYPRRRGGLVYDRRRFDVVFPAAERVDFWACDALAMPCRAGSAGLVAALNLFDCVPDPPALLRAIGTLLRPGGTALLATPYDWSSRATPVEAWVGGHSQRGPDRGAPEPRLRAWLQAGALAADDPGFTVAGELASAPWHTRLHDRSTVQYQAHLLALTRNSRDPQHE
jgi:SAM-dependent methyltransferase/uncharacterized protein YbaR (Trm112 family)